MSDYLAEPVRDEAVRDAVEAAHEPVGIFISKQRRELDVGELASQNLVAFSLPEIVTKQDPKDCDCENLSMRPVAPIIARHPRRISGRQTRTAHGCGEHPEVDGLPRPGEAALAADVVVSRCLVRRECLDTPSTTTRRGPRAARPLEQAACSSPTWRSGVPEGRCPQAVMLGASRRRAVLGAYSARDGPLDTRATLRVRRSSTGALTWL